MPQIRAVARPPQTSKLDGFATIVNSLSPLTIDAKLSILDVCGGPGYGFSPKNLIDFLQELTVKLLCTKNEVFH